MLILFLLNLLGCSSVKQEPGYDCDEINIGKVKDCQIEGDEIKCVTEVSCVKKLEWICDGRGNCFDPKL